jgi:hypothetical protein
MAVAPNRRLIKTAAPNRRLIKTVASNRRLSKTAAPAKRRLIDKPTVVPKRRFDM